MRVPSGFIVMVFLVMIAGAAVAKLSDRSVVTEAEAAPVCETSIFDADPLPVTDLADSILESVPMSKGWMPDAGQLVVMGRMAEGLRKYFAKGWVECGVIHRDEAGIDRLALSYAYEVVRAADVASDDEDDGWRLNPWGLAGTIMNESHFDRCALGLNPRKVAYEHKLLKRRKLTVSHTEKEVLSVVKSDLMQKAFRRTGFDLGTAQLLSRFYEHPHDYETMVTARGSTEAAAWFMRRYGVINKTKRPWLYWRGCATEWYDQKVTRWARKIGATKVDI